jgi:hypothetical protein
MIVRRLVRGQHGMMEMIDAFTAYVPMSDREADRLAELAAGLVRPRIRLFEMTHYSSSSVAQGVYHEVSADDVRVRFEYDQDADLSYIEQFDDAEQYNEWSEREGALNARERFVSMRRETRQFDGLRFEPFYVERKYPRRTDGNGQVVEWQTIKRWLPVGEYYPIRFTTKFSHGTDDPRHGAVRLAHKSEIHMDFDEYQDGWGDLNNYQSFGAILEIRPTPSTDDDDEWRAIDSIWGCDFYTGPGSNTNTPNTDEPYTLRELAREYNKDFRWIVSDHFGIDLDALAK